MNIETPVFESSLKEATPKDLRNAYFQINESLTDYFGMGVQWPFVRRVTCSNQISRNIEGTYETAHARITLYPRQHKESEDISDMRTAFAHETGHAFYRQLLTCNLPPHLNSVLPHRGYGVSVEEAFANFISIVDQGEGNPFKVTELLKPHITRGSLLFSPDRITCYPKEADYFKDPAFLHYIYQKKGLDTLMKFLIAVPSAYSGIIPNIISMLKRDLGRSRDREYFRRYYSLLNKLFGIDSDSLSRSANNWYSYTA